MSVPGKSSKVRQRSLGQSLVEFALVFPMFFLILTGIMDFGLFHFSRISLTNAVSEAAHTAVTQVNNPEGIPMHVQGTVQVQSTGLALSEVICCKAASTYASNRGPLNWSEPDCIDATLGLGGCTFGSGADRADSGDSVRVTLKYTYHSLIGRFFGATILFESTTQMVVE